MNEIIVHIYCSYKSSPIGFAYGSYKYAPKNNDSYYFLNNEYNNPFVLSSFEDGKIRRVCGKIPQKLKYIFLVRKLKYDYGSEHEDFGRDVSMNLAFEFDKFNEFSAFTANFLELERQSPDKLYKQLADCIYPDVSVKIYNLKINKNVFDEWFSEMIQTKSNKDFKDFDKFKDKIKITASSVQVDYSQDIIDIYQLPIIDEDNNSIVIERQGADYFYPTKKNKISPMVIMTKKLITKKIIILVILLGLLITLIMTLLIKYK